MAEELRYTNEDDENVFQQYDTISPNRNVGDCCQMAKDEWVQTLNMSIQGVNNSRKQEIVEILDPSALDCRSFYNLLKELKLVRWNNTSGDVISSTNSIVGRYFRLEKVTTSLLSSIATVAKVAGVKALTSWIQCSRDKEDEPDPQWQQQLRRDYL